MSDLPIFSARGSTESEKLAEIASYLPSLTSALNRAFLSIDFSNLNPDLADRINKGITEHQDLTGYSSKNHSKKVANEIATTLVNGVRDELSGQIDAIRALLKTDYYSSSEIDSKLEEIQESIDAIQKTVKSLDDYVNGYGGWYDATLQYELRRIKERLDKLEG